MRSTGSVVDVEIELSSGLNLRNFVVGEKDHRGYVQYDNAHARACDVGEKIQGPPRLAWSSCVVCDFIVVVACLRYCIRKPRNDLEQAKNIRFVRFVEPAAMRWDSMVFPLRLVGIRF